MRRDERVGRGGGGFGWVGEGQNIRPDHHFYDYAITFFEARPQKS